jgi:hypothetical protein
VYGDLWYEKSNLISEKILEQAFKINII